MKPIKTIAGIMAVYFYALERSDYSKLYDLKLEFQMRNFADRNDKSPKLISQEGQVMKNLLSLADSGNNIYLALKYLEDKSFIKLTYSPDQTCDKFSNIRLAAPGIDIIEGIERGEEERKEFYSVFNIKLTDKTDIESLLSSRLKSIGDMY